MEIVAWRQTSAGDQQRIALGQKPKGKWSIIEREREGGVGKSGRDGYRNKYKSHRQRQKRGWGCEKERIRQTVTCWCSASLYQAICHHSLHANGSQLSWHTFLLRSYDKIRKIKYIQHLLTIVIIRTYCVCTCTTYMLCLKKYPKWTLDRVIRTLTEII